MKPTLMITHFKKKQKGGNETDFRLRKKNLIIYFYIEAILDYQIFITDVV